MNKLKICIVVASRANYGRIKYLMKAIDRSPNLKLQLIVGASTLLERFGMAVDQIKHDGFTPDRTIPYIVEGETLSTQAKSTGLGIIELSTAFEHLMPNIVVTVADRFETMSTAIAATYMNIPLVHIQGGEVSGNLDDRVRHAITQMSDYHFVSTAQSMKRVIRMGQNPKTVFNFGCPAMDVLINEEMSINNNIMAGYNGVGDTIDWEKPYVLMVQHPVTTSYGDGLLQITESLEALHKLKGYQRVVLWPNPDAGSDDISKGIRMFRESGRADGFEFYKNFSPDDYARVLANASCAVGNSSSFIREGSFLGTPVIIIGDRQKGREHGKNIMFSSYNRVDILAKIQKQIENGPYDSDNIFGRGDAGERIAAMLTELDLDITKKQLCY